MSVHDESRTECSQCEGAHASDVCPADCCHDEHDHGYCLDCGADVTDRLMMAAEDAFEGDR